MELDPTSSPVLSPELIKTVTSFELQSIFTGFERNDGEVSPELHEERERLASAFGEDNVLTSFFVEDNRLQLGLFLRHHS